jgi:hypothetical protein
MKGAAIAAGSFAGAVSIATAINAAVVTSPDFSIGLGYAQPANNVGGVWDNSETAGVNTPTTQGDFSLSFAATGPIYIGRGAKFTNRVLVDGDLNSRAAWINDGGTSGISVFNAPVTASYNGAAPVDASATPNYQLQVVITSISVYAGSEVGSTTLGFSETTAGHAQAQTPVALTGTPGSGYQFASSYSKVTWDPADYAASLANLNDSFARTFGIPSPYSAGSDPRYIDGLEITGHVELIYDAVPEPSSIALLALSGLFVRRRRAR